MASNPRWCLAQSEWRERFAAWIDRPEPEALLNAAIFFDFRAVHGAASLVPGLRDWLAGYARDRGRFLFLMVQNALGNQPPLGFVRDFALARGGDHPGTIDLKVNGVQLFVEAARIFSLADGVPATGTLERLAGVAGVRGIPAADASAWADAFRLIQGLRLRLNAAQHARGEPLHNHLDPGTLTDGERRDLKQALRQARSLQARLARDFCRRRRWRRLRRLIQRKDRAAPAAYACQPRPVGPTLIPGWRPAGRASRPRNKKQEEIMSSPALNWFAIDSDTRFQALHKRKSRFLWGLMAFAIVYYFLLPIGAAYFTDLFKVKLWGVINFGLAFALSQFIVAWGIAWYYARKAGEFDAHGRRDRARRRPHRRRAR